MQKIIRGLFQEFDFFILFCFVEPMS